MSYPTPEVGNGEWVVALLFGIPILLGEPDVCLLCVAPHATKAFVSRLDEVNLCRPHYVELRRLFGTCSDWTLPEVK